MQTHHMSNTSSSETLVCAFCGKGEEASINLKACTACKLVKYCSRDCQIAHRPQHKKECKKRAKELHDEKLFEQPPPLDDCPICFLTLPTFHSGSTYMICCGKFVCSGCVYAPVYDDQGKKVADKKCPFCRTPYPTSDEEITERLTTRMDNNDPSVIFNRGCDYRDGICGYQQDHIKALELYHRAGELGCAKAYVSIGYAYDAGEGVEVDKKKSKYYLELSAMMGNEAARHDLGMKEEDEGDMERALKHYMIAAGSGDAGSLKSKSNVSIQMDLQRKKIIQKHYKLIKHI